MKLLKTVLASIILFFIGACENSHGPINIEDHEVVKMVAKEKRNAAIDNILKDLIKIEAGEFKMGQEDGPDSVKPVHVVFLDTFYIAKYEVTEEQYLYYLNQTGKKYRYAGKSQTHIVGEKGNYKLKKGSEGKHPITVVSWYDAVDFCKWLSKKTGLNIHLPTEAQWEKACRAGSSEKRYGDIDDVAWYSKNSNLEKEPVGQKQPNDYGLYDMLGNVSEWCFDWSSDDYYSKSPRNNPYGPPSGVYRVLRGGCFGYREGLVQAGLRSGLRPYLRRAHLIPYFFGFRIAMSNVLPPELFTDSSMQ